MTLFGANGEPASCSITRSIIHIEGASERFGPLVIFDHFAVGTTSGPPAKFSMSLSGRSRSSVLVAVLQRQS